MLNLAATLLFFGVMNLTAWQTAGSSDQLGQPSRRIADPVSTLESCGIRCNIRDPVSRIVGGNEATPHSWPWQCRLEASVGDGQFTICGASVISRDFVVTAAHCVFVKEKGYAQIPTKDFKVICGDHNWSNSREKSRQRVDVAKIIRHDRYYPGNTQMGYDIALFQLATPLTLNDYVQPICLHSHQLPAGTNCVVTGWGSVSVAGGPISDVLREVTVPLVSQMACSVDYNTITDGMLCAGNQQHGCTGDSGGPLVCSVDGQYELHGLVSYGRGCGQPGAPGVYTRVSWFKEWIQKYVPEVLVKGNFNQADPYKVCTNGPHDLYVTHAPQAAVLATSSRAPGSAVSRMMYNCAMCTLLVSFDWFMS